MKVSIFKDAYTVQPHCSVEITEVFENIKAQFWGQKIKLIREGLYKKELLPAFTPSGIIEGTRSDKNLIDYSYIICLDYDKLNNLEETFRAICKLPETFACFRSPSGKGLKVFVIVQATGLYHEAAYSQASEYFNEACGEIADTKCKNKSRLCYISSDPDMYLNKVPVEFKVSITQAVRTEYADDAWDMSVQWLFEFTEKKTPKENRNNFNYAVACNCNRFGISESRARQIAEMYWDSVKDDKPGEKFTLSEVMRSVKSAYSNTHEHGTFKPATKEI